MALKLKDGLPTAAPVVLGGDAVVWIRPATTFEVEQASAEASRVLAGLIIAEDAAARAAETLGEEFREADFEKPAWQSAAAQRLAALELSVLCVERWAGILDKDENPIQEPTRGWLALMLRDPVCNQRISSALHVGFHEEVSEKNGSAASPSGGAGTDEATAPVAA